MPDISKCSNTECLKREECYRYRSKPSAHWQSYADFDLSKNKCFISIDGWDELALIPKGAVIKNIFKEKPCKTNP